MPELKSIAFEFEDCSCIVIQSLRRLLNSVNWDLIFHTQTLVLLLFFILHSVLWRSSWSSPWKMKKFEADKIVDPGRLGWARKVVEDQYSYKSNSCCEKGTNILKVRKIFLMVELIFNPSKLKWLVVDPPAPIIFVCLQSCKAKF